MTDPGPIRFSHLRAYGRSGLHGWQARFGTEAEPTYAMERGTATHALIFGNRKVIGYQGVRRGKDFEALAALHPDTEILTMAEYDKSHRMAEAVTQNDLAAEVLRGVAEKTLLFRWSGMDCRATPDVRGPNYVTELKTTSNADPEKFVWHSMRMQYHAQMQFEMIGAKASGYKPLDAFLVAVESAEPFAVSVFHYTPRALEIGERQLQLWAERLRVCESSQAWPPYCSSVVELDVPDMDGIEYEQNGLLSVEEATILGTQA